MIKRSRYHCSINQVADELEKLYEEYPQYRGMAPGTVFNVAVKEWMNQKLNKKTSSPQDDGPVVWRSSITSSVHFHSELNQKHTNSSPWIHGTSPQDVAIACELGV